jgi:hypothetical protein
VARAYYYRILIWTTFLVLSSAGQTLHSTSESKIQEREESAINQQRSQWFYGQRAYPHKYVPAGVRLNSLRELDLMTPGEFAASLATVSNPSWKLIGPKAHQDTIHRPGSFGTRISTRG